MFCLKMRLFFSFFGFEVHVVMCLSQVKMLLRSYSSFILYATENLVCSQIFEMISSFL